MHDLFLTEGSARELVKQVKEKEERAERKYLSKQKVKNVTEDRSREEK